MKQSFNKNGVLLLSFTYQFAKVPPTTNTSFKMYSYEIEVIHEIYVIHVVILSNFNVLVHVMKSTEICGCNKF